MASTLCDIPDEGVDMLMDLDDTIDEEEVNEDEFDRLSSSDDSGQVNARLHALLDDSVKPTSAIAVG